MGAVATESLTFKVPAAASGPRLPAGPPVPAEVGAHASDFELARPHEAAVWRATGREEPVFLDRTGRRRPLLRILGSLSAALSGVSLVALATGAVGFGSLPGVPASVATLKSGTQQVALVTHAVRARSAASHRRFAVDVDRAHRRASTIHIVRV